MTLRGFNLLFSGICLLIWQEITEISCDVTKCHYCANAGSLSECRYVQNCVRSNQMCLMEEYQGKDRVIHYFAGCTDVSKCSAPNPGGQHVPDQKRCSTCCTTDLCNTHNCGIVGPTGGTNALPTAIPGIGDKECFNCSGVKNIKECTQIQNCMIGEFCYLEAYVSDTNGILYYGGCAKESDCHASTLPVQTGREVCSTCCRQSFCNYDSCDVPVQEYHAANAGRSKRQCYQCYDQRVENLELCFKTVQCASSTSQCSSVIRHEHGMIVVDLDCEDNLSCSSAHLERTTLCGECCSTDNCNRDLNCLYDGSMKTSVPSTNLTTTGQTSPVKTTTTSTTTLTTSPSSSTTTTAKTTATTTTIKTTTRRFIAGVKCDICIGSSCITEIEVRCKDNVTPFCLNHVVYDVTGTYHITKSCASVDECDTKWLQNSSNRSECMHFDSSKTYSTSFECSYCCVTDSCNKDVLPYISTLYWRGV